MQTGPTIAWLGISALELGCFAAFWAAQVRLVRGRDGGTSAVHMTDCCARDACDCGSCVLPLHAGQTPATTTCTHWHCPAAGGHPERHGGHQGAGGVRRSRRAPLSWEVHAPAQAQALPVQSCYSTCTSTHAYRARLHGRCSADPAQRGSPHLGEGGGRRVWDHADHAQPVRGRHAAARQVLGRSCRGSHSAPLIWEAFDATLGRL